MPPLPLPLDIFTGDLNHHTKKRKRNSIIFNEETKLSFFVVLDYVSIFGKFKESPNKLLELLKV